MRTVLLKSRTVLQSRDPPSTVFVFLIISLIFCLIHYVFSIGWAWRRNFVQGALVADSSSLGGCTCTCRSRVIEGFLHMHVLPAPADAGAGEALAAAGKTVIPAAAAQRSVMAPAKHARDGGP